MGDAMALYGDFLPHPYNSYPTYLLVNGNQSATIDSSDPALNVISFTGAASVNTLRMIVWQSTQLAFLASLTPPTGWHQHPDFAASGGLVIHYTLGTDAAPSLVEYTAVPNLNYITAIQLTFNNIDQTSPFKGSDLTASTASSSYVAGPLPATIKPATPFVLSTRTGILLNPITSWGDTGTGRNNVLKAPSLVQHHPDRRYYQRGASRPDDNSYSAQILVSFLHGEGTYNDDQVISIGSANTGIAIPNVKLYSLMLFLRHGFQHSTFQALHAYPF